MITLESDRLILRKYRESDFDIYHKTQGIYQENREGVRIMGVHEDTLQGLTEILEYVKGDKSKARATIVTVSDEEVDEAQLFYQKFNMLSAPCRQKAIQYVDDLLRA